MVDKLAIGKFRFVAGQRAKMDKDFAGLKHLDVRAHIEGEWVSLVKRLVYRPGTHRMWMNFWMKGLRDVYGRLDRGKNLITSSCGFELLQRSETVSELQKAAFAAWADSNWEASSIAKERYVSKTRHNGSSGEGRKGK